MNWASADAEVLAHWQKLGQFRSRHAALARGVHRKLGDTPYTFSRVLDGDRVVAVPKASGAVTIPVAGVFRDGETLHDGYSGSDVMVVAGAVNLVAKGTVLLEATK
jgi:alpha-amylase